MFDGMGKIPICTLGDYQKSSGAELFSFELYAGRDPLLVEFAVRGVGGQRPAPFLTSSPSLHKSYALGTEAGSREHLL